MSSLIYIAAIIVIAIISNRNKASKKDKSAPRGGMPTFGGGDGNPLSRKQRPVRTLTEDRPVQSGSGFPVPGGERPWSGRPIMTEGTGYEGSPAWAESPLNPTPDYETGEGLSLEQADDGDSVEARTKRMQQEMERLQSSFDGMAVGKAGNGDHTYINAAPAPAVSSDRRMAGRRDALQNGLIWAEILSPPRSRRPHPTRRQG